MSREQINRWREEAASLVADSHGILAGLPKEQQELAAVIIGQVNATVLSALADHVELTSGFSDIQQKTDARKAYALQNQALRLAAAAGDWEQYDKILANDIASDDDKPSDERSGSA